jgi:pimeloyl-ACP methyl ester carboxylesterase
MDMALKRPDLVKGVVLLGAVTHPWPGGVSWYYAPSVHPWLGGAFIRLVTIPFGYALLDNAMASVFAPSPEPAGYLDMAKVRLIFRVDSFRANAQDVTALQDAVVRLSPRYGELKMPVVAFHGTADTVSSAVLHSQPIPKAAPKGRYVPLEGVGHMPHYAAPEKIVAVIDELAEVVSRIGASR